ncbi:serine/threonine-protein kinase [Sporocytophaga myxococcoides]|uniref:serine/threonine-protein kinase n=1 Tax=Sporocytophaga myxococcoides TaxID=153721 RepID=UPI000403E4C0|nr:serine/threonine-protein kinase [Sporocytophaga myxococcoides]
MIDIKNLKIVAPKGQGYFCIVKQYVNDKTGETYALKELKKEHYSNEGYCYRFLREIKLLQELEGCENIIRLVSHGNDINNQKLWYLMPFAKANLYDYIKINNGTLTQIDRYSIVEQIINAIKYAHSRKILHRDISPNNVLVFIRDSQRIIQMSDFGLGKAIESLSYYTGSSTSNYGQILYVSPEQRDSLRDATEQSDIYSLGKLIYFIFTGKDPDNMKQFELSTLVAKATEETPQDRYKSINDLENHFNALKDLHLNQVIPIENITFREILESGEYIDNTKVHEILVKGIYIGHVYEEYIKPVNQYLSSNLSEYYNQVGNGIRDFVRTYSERLNVCYQTTGWPFSAMKKIGEILIKIIKTVNDSETKLICFKQLWYLAFEADQWAVQSELKSVFNDTHISKAIETQLSEYIISTGRGVDMEHFGNLILPKIIKASIIKLNEITRKEKDVTGDDFPF